MKKEKSDLPVKNYDTEEARRCAQWALGHHEGVYLAASASVMRAIAVGVQLLRGKGILEHGDFMRWYKKYLSCISERTCRKYMDLVNAITSKSASGAVLEKLNVAPQQLTEDYCRRMVPHVMKIIEGKTITELYQELGIVKQRKAKDQEYRDLAAKVEARHPQDGRERQLMFAQEWFGDVVDRLHKFESWANDFRVEEPALIDKAVEELKAALERLTGGKVEIRK